LRVPLAPVGPGRPGRWQVLAAASWMRAAAWSCHAC